jgi:hypothetical protein
MTKVGYPKTRESLSKLESGRYGVSINDVFALAAALGLNPVHLLTPLEDDATVAVTNRVLLPAKNVRAWIRGDVQMPMVLDIDWSQVPPSELRLAVEEWLEEQVGGRLARALMKEEFEAAVSRHVELLRKPPKREENDDAP